MKKIIVIDKNAIKVLKKVLKLEEFQEKLRLFLINVKKEVIFVSSKNIKECMEDIKNKEKLKSIFIFGNVNSKDMDNFTNSSREVIKEINKPASCFYNIKINQNPKDKSELNVLLGY